MRKGSTGGWVRAGSGGKRRGPRAGSCPCSSCGPSVLDEDRRADGHPRGQVADAVVVERDAAPRPVDALLIQPRLVGAVDADSAADGGHASTTQRDVTVAHGHLVATRVGGGRIVEEEEVLPAIVVAIADDRVEAARRPHVALVKLARLRASLAEDRAIAPDAITVAVDVEGAAGLPDDD